MDPLEIVLKLMFAPASTRMSSLIVFIRSILVPVTNFVFLQVSEIMSSGKFDIGMNVSMGMVQFNIFKCMFFENVITFINDGWLDSVISLISFSRSILMLSVFFGEMSNPLGVLFLSGGIFVLVGPDRQLF